MPIPPEVRRRLERAARTPHARSAARRPQPRAPEAPSVGAAAHVIWRWLEDDGQALAQALHRARVATVVLVDDPMTGYRGSLSLGASGRLRLCRRLGPAWGDTGEVTSPDELIRRCNAAVVRELAEAIADGSIWARVLRALGAG